MSPFVTMCHMSHVRCHEYLFYLFFQLDVAIRRREEGPLEDLEVLVMGSDVRGEERPGAGKKKYCDGKHLKQLEMSLLFRVFKFSCQLGNRRFNTSFRMVFRGGERNSFYSLYL